MTNPNKPDDDPVKKMQSRLEALPMQRPIAEKILLQVPITTHSELIRNLSCGTMDLGGIQMTQQFLRQVIATNPITRHLVQPCIADVSEPLIHESWSAVNPSSTLSLSQISHQTPQNSETLNQLIMLRRVYVQHREQLIQTLINHWAQLRCVFLSGTMLPVMTKSLNDLDNNMMQWLSRQILWLQYYAMQRLSILMGVVLPPSYCISEEAIMEQDSFSGNGNQNGLILSAAQIAILEASFSKNRVCSKVEKKFIAEKTGLSISQVQYW